MRHDVRGQGLLAQGLLLGKISVKRFFKVEWNAKKPVQGELAEALQGLPPAVAWTGNSGATVPSLSSRRGHQAQNTRLFVEQRLPPNGPQDPIARSSPSKPESNPPLPSTDGIFRMHFERLRMDLDLPRCKHEPTCPQVKFPHL